MRNLIRLVLCLFVLNLVGCAPDAPHDNPLDPGSPNRITDGNLSGKVLTLGLPYIGISGALVTIEGTNLAGMTASDGSFAFQNAPSGNTFIVITKESYLSDTLKLSLPVGGNLDTLIHLDGLPQISNSQVVTSKVDHWYPGPAYTATVSANVTDPDGFLDVDSVYVQIDSLVFGMSHITEKNYQVIINADSLPNQNLQWLVGKQFVVSAMDHEKGVGQGLGFYVSRIIESEASPKFPVGDTILATHYPVMDWDLPPSGLAFEYTFQLEVVSLAGATPIPVWSSQSGFPASTTSYDFRNSGDSLGAGDYYWTVAIVDQFGNSSRSTEAAFTIPLQ